MALCPPAIQNTTTTKTTRQMSGVILCDSCKAIVSGNYGLTCGSQSGGCHLLSAVHHLKFAARQEQLSFRDTRSINAIDVRNAVVLQRLQPVPNSTANVQYAGRRMRSQYVWYRRLRAFQPLRIYL